MQPNTAKAARVQGVAIVLVAAALGVALLHAHQRPFDRDTLAIPIGQLHAYAAEAALLGEHLRGDRLAPGFVRHHARQLATNVQRARDQLAARPAQPRFAAQQAQARELGAALESTLDALAADGRAPRRDTLGFDRLAQRLGALHQQLKPGE